MNLRNSKQYYYGGGNARANQYINREFDAVDVIAGPLPDEPYRIESVYAPNPIDDPSVIERIATGGDGTGTGTTAGTGTTIGTGTTTAAGTSGKNRTLFVIGLLAVAVIAFFMSGGSGKNVKPVPAA
jgi:hypothetical protein